MAARSRLLRWAPPVLWLGAAAAYLVVEALAASRVPGYSYAADYVSDLGRPRESPLGWFMGAAFRVQGAAFVVAGAVAVRAFRPRGTRLAFVVLACVYGAGSVVVGLVPSGQGGAAGAVHVAGATAAIVAGNAALLVAARLPFGRAVRTAGAALGTLGFASAALLVLTNLPTGLCERGAIYSIIAWQVVAASASAWGSAGAAA